jgi:hypothetical protein
MAFSRERLLFPFLVYGVFQKILHRWYGKEYGYLLSNQVWKSRPVSGSKITVGAAPKYRREHGHGEIESRLRK